MTRWCLLLLAVGAFLTGPVALRAQAPPTAPVELRSFDAEKLEKLRNDPAYQYERDLRRAPTPWERFKEWIREWLRRILGSRAGGWVAEHIIYIIVIVVIVFAVVMLSRGGLQRVFHGAPRAQARVQAVEEDIRELDLQALLGEAERSGDLRRAIRLHYLLVLRALVDRGLLEWSPDHTDREYAAQLQDGALRAAFQRSARVFQWVWYGELPLDRARYEVLRASFQGLHEKDAA